MKQRVWGGKKSKNTTRWLCVLQLKLGKHQHAQNGKYYCRTVRMESEAAAQCSVCQELLEALVLTALPWKALRCGDQAFVMSQRAAVAHPGKRVSYCSSSFLTLCVYSACNENKRGMLNI